MPSRRFLPVPPVPTSTWLETATIIVPDPPITGWTPAQIGFIPRQTGANYVRIEDLGVSIDGPGLALAVRKPAAVGKVVTLPDGVFEFNDYTEGDGSKFMHGLMINHDVDVNQARGIVGNGAGTVIQMVPNSTHFTATTSGGQGSTAWQASGNQYLCSTIQFYNFPNVEFGNLTVQGQPQVHFHHGIRINSANAYVHHVEFLGAGYGSFNMPPGETYPLMISGSNPVVDNVHIDGRRSTITVPVSATAIGLLGCTNAQVYRSYVHDLTSGFGMVQWQGSGLYSEDVWTARTGTGISGYNGCHTNHEVGGGVVRHVRPHIDLDAYFGPAQGRPRRTNGKHGHMMFMGSTGGLTDTERYIDSQIIEPVFDLWGGVFNSTVNAAQAGFCLLLDEVAINASVKPQVIKNGVSMTGVVRPNWYIDSPTINPATQYWIGANSGSGSLWG